MIECVKCGVVQHESEFRAPGRGRANVCDTCKYAVVIPEKRKVPHRATQAPAPDLDKPAYSWKPTRRDNAEMALLQECLERGVEPRNDAEWDDMCDEAACIRRRRG